MNKCRALSTLLTLCLVTACTPKGPAPGQVDYSDNGELERARNTGKSVFGLRFDEITREGAEHNFLAIRSSDVLFSQRLDSRTYFVQDVRYGHNKPAGEFQGSDEEFEKFVFDLFVRLDIPSSEIAEVETLQENNQLGRAMDGKLFPEPPEKGRKLARLSRVIDDLPVFSSKLIVGLTRDRGIGFMVLHWPEIPARVVTEAKRLAFKVEKGWLPPQQKGATVESFEAGIVHSDATGFLMDIYPAIRVVYAPEDKQIGRKMALYLDRYGKPVPQLREFDLPCEKPDPREAVPSDQTSSPNE